MTISSPPAPLIKTEHPKTVWSITLGVLILPVMFLIILPLIQSAVDNAHRATAYNSIVMYLTAQTHLQPIYDKNVAYYQHSTDIGGTGATITDHVTVYPGRYTTVLPDLIRDLTSQGYDCNGFVDKDGNSLNGLDPSVTTPLDTLNYTSITTVPSDFGTDIIAICNSDRIGGGSADYTFYNAKHDGQPATVIYIR